MKITKLLTTFLIILVVLFAGCKKDDYIEKIGVCFQVIATDPIDAARSVPYDKIVSATFSSKADASTIDESTFTLQQGTTSISGSVSYTDSTATFTPDPDEVILPLTEYTATIKNTVKSSWGNQMQADYVWTFTTMPQVTILSDPIIGGTTSGGGAFAEGATVTVTANPLPGYVFVNWTENGTFVSFSPSLNPNGLKAANGATEVSASSSYTFTMGAANRTLTANFSVIVLGNFSINLSSNPAAGGSTLGGGSFIENSVNTVTASPNNGYTFVNWTQNGVEVSTNPSYEITLTGNTTLVAHFLIKNYSMTAGGAHGMVAVSPNLSLFDHGTVVVLTATADADYSFTSWGGDASGSANPLSVTMDGNKNITANFTLNSTTYTLTAGGANGAVAKNPDLDSYNSGDIVVLTASPGVGYTFSSWGGDASGSVNPLNVTMDGNKNITANFTLIGGGVGIGPGNLDLGGAALYTVLSKTGISTTGITTITGNIGVSPNAAVGITGFGLIMDPSNEFSKSSPSTLVSGNVYAADYAVPTPANISIAVSDMENAFTTGNGKTLSVITELGAGDITGMTLAPGLYKWGTGLLIESSGVTLSGSTNDTWIFQIGQGMTVADGANIILAGDAQAKNIYWITASDAVIGKTVHFNGNILSQTLISVNTGSTVTGRLLGQTAVTLEAATVILP